EGNHRKVCDGRVDHVARAQRDQAAHRNADLLQDLALRGLPRRLPGVDASAGQSDLAGVVPEVGSAADDRHHPTACLSVEGATDRVLWRLEEMNRDGVRTVPKRVRVEIREVVGTMPIHVAEPLRDSGRVQDTLDSMFEVQERLFRWRYPDWHDFDPEGGELDV